MASPHGVTARTTVKIRSARALQDALAFNRLNIRELAVACGNDRYRSTIGHLHSGRRTTCSPHLAGRIEMVLRLPPHSLFELGVVSIGQTDSRQMRGQRAA